MRGPFLSLCVCAPFVSRVITRSAGREHRIYSFQARQELAQSLYQHDAACRVIARLTKERNEARSALANARAAMTHATAAAHHEPAPAAAAAAPAGMDVDRPAAAAGLPAEALDRLTKTGTELLTKRKKREVPATLASPDTIKTFKSGKPVADLHAAGKISLELSSHDANLAITGGIDGRVTLLDISTGKARTTIDAHKAGTPYAAFSLHLGLSC
jgi:pre-mRNA-processing factor 19